MSRFFHFPGEGYLCNRCQKHPEVCLCSEEFEVGFVVDSDFQLDDHFKADLKAARPEAVAGNRLELQQRLSRARLLFVETTPEDRQITASPSSCDFTWFNEAVERLQRHFKGSGH